MKANTTNKDPRVTIENLRQRHQEHAEELDQLAEDRGKLALAAAEGDMPSLDRLRELDERERTLKTSMSNVSAALAHATEILKPILKAEQSALFAANRTKAEKAREDFIAISADCDKHLLTLADMLRRRDAIAAEMYAHRYIRSDSYWLQVKDEVHRARYIRPIEMAASTAGLSPFMPSLQQPSPMDTPTLADFARAIHLPIDREG